MSERNIPGLLPLLEQTFVHKLEELSDAELLRRFALSNDESAFAMLLRRYGSLVLGICRRVLRDPHDTDDAFQATFLIFARKAPTIHKREAICSWLYKVAYRIALRARAGRARREMREQEALQRLTERQARAAPPSFLGDLVDEEVQRLPEKYRVPVLLCYLQGQTNEEAARCLRCPSGTLKIRLLRARDLLRRRLKRRGLALPLAALVAAMVESASAAVPPALEQGILHVASLLGQGYSPPAAGLSLRVAALVEASLKRMCRAKLKVALAMLVTVLLCAGTEGLTQAAGTADAIPVKNREATPFILPRNYDGFEGPSPSRNELTVAAAVASCSRPRHPQ
jgi:RNA polymerase sigma factor (sigma-70 family)